MDTVITHNHGRSISAFTVIQKFHKTYLSSAKLISGQVFFQNWYLATVAAVVSERRETSENIQAAAQQSQSS